MIDNNYPIDPDKIKLAWLQGTVLIIPLHFHIRKIQSNCFKRLCKREFFFERLSKNDLSKLKIFASHGTADQVIPVAWARKTNLSGQTRISVYKEYPIGHGISPQIFMILKLAKNKKRFKFGTFFFFLIQQRLIDFKEILSSSLTKYLSKTSPNISVAKISNNPTVI
jgi:hypothetical protein